MTATIPHKADMVAVEKAMSGKPVDLNEDDRLALAIKGIELGWTKHQLAARMGVNSSTAARYLRRAEA